MENKTIKGFSKLSKEAKIEWLTKEYLEGDDASIELLKSYWHNDTKTQKLHDEFIENTLTNFYLPFGVAPNFMINNKVYCLPMAIEESSVVAAAAKSASFWLNRGGFSARVISTIKVGHVHFAWYGKYERLLDFFTRAKDKFFQNTENLTANMRARGGGILDIQLVNKCDLEPNYYQLMAKFETCDSMGANFINSLLEEFSKTLTTEIENDTILTDEEKKIQVIMCILSNYTPECLVRSEVSCKVEELTEGTDMSPELFVEKFVQAIHVATIEPYRATTHNKGIFNGIDSVVLATGNDFRAVEACGHTYAAKDGQYKSLTHVSVEEWNIPILDRNTNGIRNRWWTNQTTPHCEVLAQTIGKSKCRRINDDHRHCGISTEFWGYSIVGYYRNTERTHENALIEYSKSTRGY